MKMPDWDSEKQKLLSDFLTPQQMTNRAMAPMPSGMATPPADGGLPPAPPSDLTASHQQMTLETKAPTNEGPGPNEEENTDARITDSNPGHEPDKLAQYVQNQQGQIDKWGPDKQAALMQHLQEGYRKPGYVIAKGGATLADAIMQGVARAGSSGNLAAIDERENQNLNRAAEMGKSLNEQNISNLGAKRSLESMTSSTPLGGAQSKAAQFLAKQLYPNISPEKLAEIGSNPQALTAILPAGVDLKKALAEIENTAAYRKAELGLQGATLENTKTHQRAEEENVAESQKFGGLKALADRGPVDKFFGLIPGTTTNQVKKALEEQAGISGQVPANKPSSGWKYVGKVGK